MDRVAQINWIRQLAANLTDSAPTEVTVAEDLVAYALSDTGRLEQSIELPEWFDSHDRGLLVEYVQENLGTVLAEAIYWEVFEGLDDKEFLAIKIGEIRDWLDEGGPEDMTLVELVAEWREYDPKDIKERIG